MSDRFLPFAEKMRADGLSASAVRAFEHHFRALERRETGLIPESLLASIPSLPSAAALATPPSEVLTPLLQRTLVIKLNGGLGTGMGLDQAKSLLPVRDGLSFLDLIARQILHLRSATGGGPVPRFLLMNSFSTSVDSLHALAAYPALGPTRDLEFLQTRVPKILAHSLAPLSWPDQPELEWCPPGHGDLYPSLAASGWLDRLLAQGITYAFVSNADNLGATLDPALLAWFAHSQSPFLMEVTRRTPADKKGGHLALRTADGRLVLRESAQCPDADAASFQDIERHRFFNTNNLWIRLDHLREALAQHHGTLPLPMIRNAKTADPRDPASPEVYQLETAMGAAIESFPGALAIEVSRARFAPVKTTGDLLVIRSDACLLTPDFRLQLAPSRLGVPPEVDLDPAHYKLMDGLDRLLADAVPSLLHCQKLRIQGPAHVPPGVVLRGAVRFHNPAATSAPIPAGTYADGDYHLSP